MPRQGKSLLKRVAHTSADRITDLNNALETLKTFELPRVPTALTCDLDTLFAKGNTLAAIRTHPRMRTIWLTGISVSGFIVCFIAFAAWRLHRSRLDDALIFSVASNNLYTVKTVLADGANPNVRVRPRTGRLTLLERLMSMSMGGDHSDYAQPTAVILAADKGNAEIVKLLLDKGADPNLAEGGGGTPLMYASMSDNSDCVRFLLKAGAKVNAKDTDGVPSLQRASVYCRPDSVKLLLQNRADPNATANDGSTAIMYAAREGNIEITRSLIAAGADVTKLDKDGYSALRWAREQKHKDVEVLLRRAGVRN
jgi:ankyrin repeat protein